MKIPKIINNIEIRKLPPAPLPKLAQLSRKIAANGAVLLKNSNSVLPFKGKEKISIFGRSQFEYAKSGTGSGGRINTEYTVNIYDGLKSNGNIEIYEPVSDAYRAFIKESPFDYGHGWVTEPWSQIEMPLSEVFVAEAANNSDKALIVISRLCGEARDNTAEEGSYFLQKTEYDMIKTVCKHFKKVCVALNIGSIIDFSWISDIRVPSVILLWQGGQEGGNAAADVLCGKVTPSGKLTDTIAKSIEDYPSHKNFGSRDKLIYEEDIYVGYRYFETFAKNKVLYPFGFGLSYTKFTYTFKNLTYDDGIITFYAEVTNVGKCKGAEVMQLYLQAPHGKIDRPTRELLDFAKTKVLKPGETCTVKLSVAINDMATYDDSGITGHKSCYVLEPGQYRLCCGTDVRSADYIFTFVQHKLKVVKKLQEAMAPVESFKRFKSVFKDEKYTLAYEDVPIRSVDLQKRIENNQKKPIPFSGDKGFKLKMVSDEKCSMRKFIAQLTPDEMACMFMGEGMCSPKVKSGTGGAFGGVTNELLSYGIPVACCTDGPSGLRFDTGEKATALPVGTLLASTWDTKAVETLYQYEAMEAYAYNVDALLGPGMNIHRHHLNGRNFEYFSEDPLLCGRMAAAVSNGLSVCNITATLKHFACNNQEENRFSVNTIVSERALREIYLKCFEIAVKTSRVKAIMTSYNQINGIHSTSNYDLNTTILRKEWGYDGIVMTDWWPLFNDDNAEESKTNKMTMVRAQNDLSMTVPCAKTHNDNIMEAYNNGTLTLYEMQRNAQNILNYLITTNTFKRFCRRKLKLEHGLIEKKDKLKVVDEINLIESGKDYSLHFNNKKPILLEISFCSSKEPTVQSAINIFNNSPSANSTIVVNGTEGEEKITHHEIIASEQKTNLMFNFNSSEIIIKNLKILQ